MKPEPETLRAIARSVAQREIIHLPFDPLYAADLLIECDDHAETGDTHEYWGVTDSGDTWRVHLDIK